MDSIALLATLPHSTVAQYLNKLWSTARSTQWIDVLESVLVAAKSIPDSITADEQRVRDRLIGYVEGALNRKMTSM